MRHPPLPVIGDPYVDVALPLEWSVLRRILGRTTVTHCPHYSAPSLQPNLPRSRRSARS